jgi:hypothetical protein
MKLLLVLLLLGCTGCAPVLGAHVHRITHRGVTYIKCTVITEEDRPELAHASLAVCADAIEHPAPMRK